MGKTKKAKDTNSVIKWSPSWLVQLDFLKSPLKEWCRPHTTGHALCIYDNSVIDYGTQGFHALFQHSKAQKHKDVHDAKNDSQNMKLTSTSSSSKSSTQTSSQPPLFPTLGVIPPLADRVTDAEIFWLMKLCACDFSFASCDDIVKLFDMMFGCDVTQDRTFTLGSSKVSYVIAHGLGPYCLKQLVEDVKKSLCAFTLMFDETTTAQRKKQMDFLVRYWSEMTSRVETSYLTSAMFGRAKAEKLTELVLGLQDDEVMSDLPWN